MHVNLLELEKKLWSAADELVAYLIAEGCPIEKFGITAPAA